MPRFVILEHDHPHLHWDLMLQAGDVLRTWRLERPPRGCAQTILAERIGDHRLAYLDYEGPISGGRGFVKRWDWGTYEILEGTQYMRLRLLGRRTVGLAILEAAGEKWQLVLPARVEGSKIFTCPCCGFQGLRSKPYARMAEHSLVRGFAPPYVLHFGTPSYEVCACCGFEFGNDYDPGTGAAPVSFEDYLEDWVREGTVWFREEERPQDWTLERQLASAEISKPNE